MQINSVPRRCACVGSAHQPSRAPLWSATDQRSVRDREEIAIRRVVVSVLGIALIATLSSGCSSSASPMPIPPSSDDRASWTCPDPINVAVPTWARDGFTRPTDPVPHLLGTAQAIVAVPFGWPLRDHQLPGHDNKILWIAKSGVGPLHIVATEQATGEIVTKELPNGPGPSIVDMPKAGCWRFTLSWADQQDEMLIRYYGVST